MTQTQKLLTRRLGLTLAVFFVALFIPAFIVAQHTPLIPHALERRDDCLACHQTGFAGTPKIPANHINWANDTCQDCHLLGDKAEPIPPSMEEAGDCLICHETGSDGSPKYPDDHTGRTNDVCLICHQVTMKGTPTVVPTATPGIPDISHPLEGRSDCLLCHQAGGSSAQVPDNHAGGTNDICLACHQLPPTEEATPGATPAIPVIPHAVEGWDDCLACHQTGVGGGAQVPDDHTNWTSDICRGCHPPGATRIVPVPAPDIGHAVEEESDCRACHQTGIGGASKFPADHSDWPNEICRFCHQLGPVAANIPHPVPGWNDCRGCHETGNDGAPQFPNNHAGRANDTCRECHQPSSIEVAPPEAPEIPHILDGRHNCLSCHGTGLAGFTQVPDHHAGWNDNVCGDCHRIAATIAHDPPAFMLIPHALERREDCRACHATGAGGTQFPANHVDWPNEICQGCHLLDAPPPVPQRHCFECHVIGSRVSGDGTSEEEEAISTIPHELDSRNDCLSCHQGGVGRANRIPENHDDQSNEMCEYCHQPGSPAPEPIPIPTPTLYPWPEGFNSCRDCHLTLKDKRLNVVAQWEHSIHFEHQVSCVDCHNGNPEAGTKEGAKAPGTGYIGVPAKTDIAALCLKCHPNLAWMSQDDIPAGQWTKYEDSVHSLHLAKEIRDKITCFDCHGGHQMLRADNPASIVYPANVPGLCVSCHADEVSATAGETLTNTTFRRWAMAVAIAIGGLIVMVLYMRNRETNHKPDTTP